MRAIEETIERIKYADAALKKKIILGAVAGVLFLVAGVLLLRAFSGPDVPQANEQTQQAAAELREQLTSEQTPETIDEDIEPFSRGAQPEPK